jgi:WD40 repeat protein
MKSIRNIAPALLVLVLIVGAALVVGLMNRSGAEQLGPEQANDAPNAGLSNREWVTLAVTDMSQLTSYHMEFVGPVLWGQNTVQLTYVADVQTPDPRDGTFRGSTYKFHLAQAASDDQALPVQDFEIIAASDGHLYVSEDGGKTGSQSEYAGLFYDFLVCCWYWRPYWDQNAPEATPTEAAMRFSTPSEAPPVPAASPEGPGAQLPPAANTDLLFEDGNPLLEQVGGITTRHVAADVSQVDYQTTEYPSSSWYWPEKPAKVELWISMDETPTVRKMVVTGNSGGGDRGTWTWSRLNEDLGTFGPPAAPGTDSPAPPPDPTETTAPTPVPPTPDTAAAAPQSDSEVRTLTGHTDAVISVAFSPDGKSLVSASSDNTVRLWRVEDGSTIGTFTGATSWAQSPVFSPDGQMIAHASDAGTVRLWRAADGAAVRTLRGDTGDVWTVAFSPDGQMLAAGSSGDTVTIWKVADGTVIRALAEAGSVVAFSPDGQTLASAFDKTIKVWRVADGTLIRTLDGHTNWMNGLAFSPDGQLLASASADRTLKLWRVADGSLVHTLRGHNEVVRSVAFSPDGQMLASSSVDDTVRLWRVADGAAVKTLTGHTDSVISVAFSPDGTLLASASFDRTIKLWRVK